MRDPTIGVFVPVRNGEARIRDALDSVAEQTRPADEIIVVDDGSTDDTVHRVQQWCREEDRDLELIRQRRKGVAAACNTAVEASGSELLVRLDADDLLLSHHLETLVESFLGRPETVLCFGDARREYPDGSRGEPYLSGTALQNVASRPIDSELERVTGSLFSALVSGSFIATCAAMFSRRAARTAGLWDPTFSTAEDRDFWLRLCRTGGVAFTRQPVAVVRYHSANLTHPRHAVRDHRNRLRVTRKSLEEADSLDLSAGERAAAERAYRTAAREYLYAASRDGLAAWCRAFCLLLEYRLVPTALYPKALLRATWQHLQDRTGPPSRPPSRAERAGDSRQQP